MLREIGPEDAPQFLPDIVRLGEVPVDDINILVMALGYEERALSCLRELSNRQVTVDFAVIWEYPSELGANEENRPELEQLLEGVGARPVYVQDHGSLNREIMRLVDDLPPSPALAVDLSVMTGRLALAALDAIPRAIDGPGARVIALYAEAKEYLPTRQAYEKSRDGMTNRGSFGHDDGVLSVDATANLRGSHDPQLRDLVLVIPGFSRDRVRAAISYVNPALLLTSDKNVRWAVSVPHLEVDLWREAAMREIHALTSAEAIDRVSTFDYKGVYQYLEELFDKEWLDSNLTIVFLGSKLQALAVGLFCIVRRGVRVVVAAPEAYVPTSYTRGTREVWAVDFTDWYSTVRNLAKVGTVQFVD